MTVQLRPRALFTLLFVAIPILLLGALTPYTQASSVLEKFPSSTSQITAEWYNPTNAYVLDDAFVDTDVDGAEQEYAGFAFGLDTADIVEKAWVKVGPVYSYMGVDNIDTAGGLRFDIKVWDGSAWTSVEAHSQGMEIYLEGEGASGDSLGYPAVSGMVAFDASSILDTPAKVNAVKLRSYVYLETTPSYFGIGFDALSVEVAYTTAETDISGMAPFFLLGLMVALPIGILLIKKKG